MEKANVYFTTFKATEHENLLQKLHRLMKTARFISASMAIWHFYVRIMPGWWQIM